MRSIQIFSAEHVKVKQRAKEIQRSRTTHWCWRSYSEQRPHTVVLKGSADHAVAEFQRQKTVLRVSATRCCKLPDLGVREHPPRNDDHAVTQYFAVVLGVPGRPRSGKLPQSGTGGRERESHRQKSSFQQKCYIVELDRTCDEQIDEC